jgi:hypothetical protein
MQQSSEQQITNNDRRNFLKLAGIAAVGGVIGLNAACYTKRKS